MFKTKRKEHHHIIQTLGQMQTDVKRYKAVQMLLDQIFKVKEDFYAHSQSKVFIQVLNESRIALTSAGFVPSVSPFPTEEATRERRFEDERRKIMRLVFRIIIIAGKCAISRGFSLVLSGCLSSFLWQRSTTSNLDIMVVFLRSRNGILRWKILGNSLSGKSNPSIIFTLTSFSDGPRVKSHRKISFIPQSLRLQTICQNASNDSFNQLVHENHFHWIENPSRLRRTNHKEKIQRKSEEKTR